MTRKVRSRIGLLVLVLSWLAVVLPARPVAALPPRPDPDPETIDAPAGGAIELRLWSAGTVDWSAMQTGIEWQDGSGGWHAVDGWRGPLDEQYADGGRKTWWVDEEHLGTGPFRWVVYQDGELCAASEGFMMPASQGALVRTIVPMDGQ